MKIFFLHTLYLFFMASDTLSVLKRHLASRHTDVNSLMQVSHIQKKNTFYEGAHVIITCCHFGILGRFGIKGVISSAAGPLSLRPLSKCDERFHQKQPFWGWTMPKGQKRHQKSRIFSTKLHHHRHG